jgi:cell division septum initiation protein DivIVA
VRVALDRQSIEKKDFPIGGRGYEPAAVDAHLAALADEIDELKRSSPRRTESLAAGASEHVRAIVQAAETSASEIQRQAEEEAREIRAQASAQAQITREQATSQARDNVEKVSRSTASLVQRLEALENEMGALFESLRTGSDRLSADLQVIGENLEEVSGALVARPRHEPEASEALVGPALATEAVPAVEATAAADGDRDETEAARLTALNMALADTPREEIDRFLADNYKLTDRRKLLDEVFENVGS